MSDVHSHLLSGSHEIHANNQAISMFRASPWVPYQPTAIQKGPGQPLVLYKMDQDVEMDAPQISTLREEETPPPQSKSGVTRRGKTAPKPSSWPRPRPKEFVTDEEYEEVEEEEDQLIDDDDDDMMKPVPPTSLPPSGRSTDAASRRKSPSKRKQRRNEKRIAEIDEKKTQEKVTLSQAGADNLAPTISWFKAMPSEGQEDASQVDNMQVDISANEETSKPTAPVGKSPRKQPATLRQKVARQKTTLPILADDTGIASEGYTGTAASSPVTAHLETNSPEPEPAASLEVVPSMEETSLENVPLPVYPLPNKPFPVQPPPKIVTGFAPAATLDRSRKKVRHWRVAQREIRGIAGGRWFVRSWVGEKDSEYATGMLKNSDERVAIPRLSGVSISALAGGKGSGKGKKTVASSLAASAAPSRSGSSIPDAPPSGTRAPTKMRSIIGPPSEAGDSDATAVPGS